MVVSALAILSTGAVYVPCDERLPWQRVEHMTQDARVTLILAGLGLQGSSWLHVIPLIGMSAWICCTVRTSAAATDPALDSLNNRRGWSRSSRLSYNRLVVDCRMLG